MRILPVIDLMRGVVVRGIAGRRETYAPLESRLAADARPATIARALAERGALDCYVADLDAIAGAEPVWAIYRELIDVGLRPWVDAGCRDATAAAALADFEHAGTGFQRIIVGLESLASVDSWQAIRGAVGAERLVFSLDLKDGVPLAQPGVWPGASSEGIAREVLAGGARGIIILDLAAVGGYGGPATLALCERVRAQWPHVEIISGGGAREEADLAKFAAAGCDYVLVASALHDGRITLSTDVRGR